MSLIKLKRKVENDICRFSLGPPTRPVTKCEDFHLCIDCYKKEGHPHKMEKQGLHSESSDGASSSNPIEPEKAKKEAQDTALSGSPTAQRRSSARFRRRPLTLRP